MAATPKFVMPYRYLGNCGLKVSSICLGTMTFGEAEDGRPGHADEQTAHAIMDRFVEMGGNFIDTADIYQFGLSETIIGNWLANRPHLRPRLILATKVWGPMEDDVNGKGLSRHHITHAVEQSLRRLQTDYIDLYQTHCWDSGTPVEETLRALHDLVLSGKVHYIGVSNVTGWQFQHIIDVCRQLHLTQIVSNQAQYSLLCRSTEWELVEVCKRDGIAMLPWSPLKGGLLTGKFTRGSLPSDPSASRVAWVEADKEHRKNQSHPSLSDHINDAKYWSLIGVMRDIAAAHNVTVCQVAIAWLLHQPTVTSVIIGVRTLEQLEDNLNSVQVSLTKEELDLLEEHSREPLPYPYEMVSRLQKGRERT